MVPISSVDKKLGHYIIEQFKPVILVINKFDLAKAQADSEDFTQYLTEVLPGLDYAPIAFTTATEGRNVQSALDLSASLFKQANTRVSTSELNEALREIIDGAAPGVAAGKGGMAKIYYGSQVAVGPPTIVLFCNDPRRVSPAFERFLTNRFRELLPFPEVPIRLLFRTRGGESIEDLPRLSRRRRAQARGRRNR
jgi:GTP-binding protein